MESYIYLNIQTSWLLSLFALKVEQLMCLKSAGCKVIIVESVQMPHSSASDLGLHCLFRRACPNT